MEDYRTLRLSLRAHPLSFLRERLAARSVLPAEALLRARDGDRAATAGLVLVRQRPGSAKGVIFMTLEDETGTVNVVVWPNILERYRPAVLGARLALVRGKVQRAGEIVHLVAAHLEDLTHWLDLLTPDKGAVQPSTDSAGAGRARRQVAVHNESRPPPAQAARDPELPGLPVRPWRRNWPTRECRKRRAGWAFGGHHVGCPRRRTLSNHPA